MGEVIIDFIQTMGIVNITWQQIVMIMISCILLYLAIAKGFEPLLLIPIAFGMLLSNLPLSGVMNEAVSKIQLISPEGVDALKEGTSAYISTETMGGLLNYLFLGDELGIFPPLIFLGVGAMTDFAPLIANPKSILLGAAAQFGIFTTFLGALVLGFGAQAAASIGIIGGADGPTAIYLATKLAPELLAPIAVAAYSYMALVPIIQPPIMKALTTKEERSIVMTQSKPVSKKAKIMFPIVVTIVVSLLLPSAASLVGMLMFGNLLKESGATDRLSDTASNALMNIVTIFLGVSVGASAEASIFLSAQTLMIFGLGILAFGVGTAVGVIFAKLMNLVCKEKVNPLIGSAGVSAVPMAARVSQKVAQEECPGNFILMHAMGPNVAGVIGSAVAAGILLSLFG